MPVTKLCDQPRNEQLPAPLEQEKDQMRRIRGMQRWRRGAMAGAVLLIAGALAIQLLAGGQGHGSKEEEGQQQQQQQQYKRHHPVIGNVQSKVGDEIPFFWRDYCQFLEEELTGDEGDRQFRAKGGDLQGKLKLRGVAIAFRHGDRSPITVSPEDCSPIRAHDRSAFDRFQDLVYGEPFQEFLNPDRRFARFRRTPDRAKCAPGNLTAEGALAHVRLGKYLGSRYDDLFRADHVNLTATASNYSRTFQSAIAFLSEFVYADEQRRMAVPRVDLHFSNVTTLCHSEECVCKDVTKMRHECEQELLLDFQQNWNWTSDQKQTYRLLLESLGAPERLINRTDPLQFIDFALGNYICRRKPLPCARRTPTTNDEGDGATTQSCVTYGYLDNLVERTTNRSRRMLAHKSQYILKRLAAAEAQAILTHLHEQLNLVQNESSVAQVNIFSGHEVTLEPIMFAFGVNITDPAHYASRLIFEIYTDETSAAASPFIRLVYNGEDRTAEIVPCQPLADNGLCAAAKLKQFVETTIFLEAGFANRSETCDLSESAAQ